jgi:NAD(P)-dependent dehydrogenase (short-subunit alcohol dehydrogenase family)
MTNSPQTVPPAAIVTGASRGIGRAIALALAKNHQVVVNFHTNVEAAQETVDSIKHNGGAAIAVQADVATSAGRQQLIDAAIAAAGRLEVLVNNAGITSPGRLDVLETTEENWESVLGTNLKGPFFLAQSAARQMIRQPKQSPRRGTIVNVSSISAYAVSHNRPEYCIAKSALKMMTHLFASRLADENIMVYEVCPGVIASDMTAPVKDKYDKRIADGLSPIRRWGEPADVAKAVSTLVDNAFSFCTGQCIHVDGGFHIRRL